eukprot:763082-Hanusia_phi.AAC.1
MEVSSPPQEQRGLIAGTRSMLPLPPLTEALAVETFQREKLSSVSNVIGLQIKFENPSFTSCSDASAFRPQDISSALKVLKNFLLNQARQPNVVDAASRTCPRLVAGLTAVPDGEQSRSKILLLNPEHVQSLVVEELPVACQEFVKEKDGDKETTWALVKADASQASC